MKKILVLLLAPVFVLGMVGVAAPLSLPITNPTFDHSGTSYNGWAAGVPAPWGSAGDVGIYNAEQWALWLKSQGYPSVPETYTGHDGSDVGLVYSNGGVLGQWLDGVSPAYGRTYTLSVQAAGRDGFYDDATYRLRLVAGTPDHTQWVELTISDPFTPVEGEFQSASLIYTPSSLDPTYSVLGINLLVFGAGGSDQILFDNVSLENEDTGSSVPDSSIFLLLGPSLVGLGMVGRRKFVK